MQIVNHHTGIKTYKSIRIHIYSKGTRHIFLKNILRAKYMKRNYNKTFLTKKITSDTCRKNIYVYISSNTFL